MKQSAVPDVTRTVSSPVRCVVCYIYAVSIFATAAYSDLDEQQQAVNSSLCLKGALLYPVCCCSGSAVLNICSIEGFAII